MADKLDGVQIRDPGPKLGSNSIVALEQRLGGTLPCDYREFLLRFNGGRPNPDTVAIDSPDIRETDVQEFLGIGRSDKCSNIDWNLDVLRDSIPADCLSIACDSFGNAFTLQIGGDGAGTIRYHDFESDPWRVFQVASSFTAFMQMLHEFDPPSGP